MKKLFSKYQGKDLKMMLKTGGDKSKNTVNKNEQNTPIQNLLNSDTRRKVGKDGVGFRDRRRCKPKEKKIVTISTRIYQ